MATRLEAAEARAVPEAACCQPVEAVAQAVALEPGAKILPARRAKVARVAPAPKAEAARQQPNRDAGVAVCAAVVSLPVLLELRRDTAARARLHQHGRAVSRLGA